MRLYDNVSMHSPAGKLMDKKQVISWCLFDFANSSYSAVIAAVIFPVYYTGVIVGNNAGEGDLWWGWAISLSMLFIALSSPFLGGIADYSGLRKRLLAFYTALCVVALSGFSLLTPGAVITGFILIVFANIGMEGGLVFYNSFLPRIAPVEYHGRVSSWGFGVGYAGSIASLLIALPLIQSGHYGLTWIAVAVFFTIFSLPAVLFLPGDARADVTAMQAGIRLLPGIAAGVTGSLLGGVLMQKTGRVLRLLSPSPIQSPHT